MFLLAAAAVPDQAGLQPDTSGRLFRLVIFMQTDATEQP